MTLYAISNLLTTHVSMNSYNKNIIFRCPLTNALINKITDKYSRISDRDVESKDFSFYSQLSVPKIVRETESQLPSPKDRLTPKLPTPYPRVKRFFVRLPTFNCQSPKLLGGRTLNSKAPTPNSDPTPGISQ